MYLPSQMLELTAKSSRLHQGGSGEAPQRGSPADGPLPTVKWACVAGVHVCVWARRGQRRGCSQETRGRGAPAPCKASERDGRACDSGRLSVTFAPVPVTAPAPACI